MPNPGDGGGGGGGEKYTTVWKTDTTRTVDLYTKNGGIG